MTQSWRMKNTIASVNRTPISWLRKYVLLYENIELLSCLAPEQL